MEFQSPGGAFANSIDESLMRRAAMQRQTMLDNLTVKKEADLAQYRQQELEAGKAALQEKRDEHAQTMEDRARKQTVDDVGGMVMGDVPDPELLARAQKYHVPVRLTAPQAQQPPAPMAGTAGMPGVAPPGPVQPEDTPAGIAAVPDRQYAGNRQEQDKTNLETKVRGLIDRMSSMNPDSPEFRKAAMEYEMVSGKTLPAGSFKAGGTTGEAIMRQHPTTGAVEQLVNGQWQPFTGSTAADKSHWMTVPPPKDTSAGDDRRSRQVDTIREKGYGDTKEFAKPLLAQIASVEGLSTALNQNTDVADSVIAPMVLKATVSGTGSGFRMTQAEINNVLKGTRTNWESLQIALNKWSNDGGMNPDGTPNPKKPLVLDADQRVAIRKLAREIRQTAIKKYKKVTDADDALDKASSVEEVNRIRTKLKRDVVTEDEPDDSGGGGVPSIGSVFNGGKVLKVTPIK